MKLVDRLLNILLVMLDMGQSCSSAASTTTPTRVRQKYKWDQRRLRTNSSLPFTGQGSVSHLDKAQGQGSEEEAFRTPPPSFLGRHSRREASEKGNSHIVSSSPLPVPALPGAAPSTILPAFPVNHMSESSSAAALPLEDPVARGRRARARLT